MWRLASFILLVQALVDATQITSGPGTSLQPLPAVSNTTVRTNGTCTEWTAWLPPRTNPAIVVQVISTDYADVERNFIAVMETNSQFSRDNLYLVCLDEESVVIFQAMNIHCVFVADVRAHRFTSIWRLRVNVISCLLEAGLDVLASDADALWANDPMIDLQSPRHNQSSIVASRGAYPLALTREWGSTMCMGFVLFRASGTGMRVWQKAMTRIGGDTGDDQIALNQAAVELGIVWDANSDMRFQQSTGEGRGVVPGLTTANGAEFTVTLLPHSRYTRRCTFTPPSNETVVAHCSAPKRSGAKTSWMKESNLWYC